MSRLDLKQLILLLYAKPQQAPAEHQHTLSFPPSSFSNMGAIADAFSGLSIPLTTSPPALRPAEKLWLFANLTSFVTQKSTPAAPKISAPSTSASGGVCLFDAFEKTTNSEGVAMGFDDGAVVVKMGREEPAVSMDGSGKIVWAKHNEVVSTVIKGSDASVKDGAPLALPRKDRSCEVYLQTLSHSPNGQFVSVCGDGEYITYTALAWRNKAFRQALDFAWGSKDNSNDYAIHKSPTSVKIFRNFKEVSSGLNFGFQAEGFTDGVLVDVNGPGGIGMFDWETGNLVHHIEVKPKAVSSICIMLISLFSAAYTNW